MPPDADETITSCPASCQHRSRGHTPEGADEGERDFRQLFATHLCDRTFSEQVRIIFYWGGLSQYWFVCETDRYIDEIGRIQTRDENSN